MRWVKDSTACNIMPGVSHLFLCIVVLFATYGNTYLMCNLDKGRLSAYHCRSLLDIMKDAGLTPFSRHETHTQLFAPASLQYV